MLFTIGSELGMTIQIRVSITYRVSDLTGPDTKTSFYLEVASVPDPRIKTDNFLSPLSNRCPYPVQT
jgi:hypothetical protein